MQCIYDMHALLWLKWIDNKQLFYKHAYMYTTPLVHGSYTSHRSYMDHIHHTVHGSSTLHLYLHLCNVYFFVVFPAGKFGSSDKWDHKFCVQIIICVYVFRNTDVFICVICMCVYIGPCPLIGYLFLIVWLFSIPES